MKKYKQCMGINKAKDFKSCGNDVLANTRKYGLCPSCLKLWVKETKEGLNYALSCIPRAKKEVTKDIKEKKKKAKIENKSIAVLIQEARKPFQKLIRIRDHKQKCICCDEYLPYEIGKYDAGHYKKAEIYTGLIFHPDNVHGQRVYCNQHLNGNEGNYTNGLIKRIGWAKYEKLVFNSNKLKQYKWDRLELIKLKAHYDKELRLVESFKKDISDVNFSVGII